MSAICSNPVLWSQFKLGRGRTSPAPGETVTLEQDGHGIIAAMCILQGSTRLMTETSKRSETFNTTLALVARECPDIITRNFETTEFNIEHDSAPTLPFLPRVNLLGHLFGVVLPPPLFCYPAKVPLLPRTFSVSLSSQVSDLWASKPKPLVPVALS